MGRISRTYPKGRLRLRTPRMVQSDKKYPLYIEYNWQADNACKSTGISVSVKEWNEKVYNGVGEIRATANMDYKYYNNALHKRIEDIDLKIHKYCDIHQYIICDIINLVNRYVKGNVDIGRIDLTANCSFFEVPEGDAEYVMRKMAKAKVGDRRVVVDSADRQGESADRQRPNRAARRAERFGGQRHEDYSQRKGGRKGGRYADADQFEKPGRDNDWRQFFDK